MVELTLVLILVGLIVGIIFAISSPRDMRNPGTTNMVSVALHEMMDTDKRKANETILEQSANKKM